MGSEGVGWEAIAGCVLGGFGHSLAIAIGNPVSAYRTARQYHELRANIQSVNDRMFGYHQAANRRLAINRALFRSEVMQGLVHVARETVKFHACSFLASIAGGALIGYYKKDLYWTLGWGGFVTLLESGAKAYRAIVNERVVHV